MVPTPTVLPVTVRIHVKRPFASTFIELAAGEAVNITATGTINYSTNQSCGGSPCLASPAGAPPATCKKFTGFTEPALPCWSLIGKIGREGTPFEVGTSLALDLSSPGVLYLGVNDNFYPDNSGEWTAVVSAAGT